MINKDTNNFHNFAKNNIMWKVFLASVIIVGVAVAAIAIKMFLVKGGEFEKKCGCGKSEEGAGCSSHCEDHDRIHGKKH